MFALILALALAPAALAPAAAVPLAPTAAPSAPAPVLDTPASDAQLVQLQALFDQSCAQRAYATYDDLCSALQDQIKSVQREADRSKRLKSVPVPAGQH